MTGARQRADNGAAADPRAASDKRASVGDYRGPTSASGATSMISVTFWTSFIMITAIMEWSGGNRRVDLIPAENLTERKSHREQIQDGGEAQQDAHRLECGGGS